MKGTESAAHGIRTSIRDIEALCSLRNQYTHGNHAWLGWLKLVKFVKFVHGYIGIVQKIINCRVLLSCKLQRFRKLPVAVEEADEVYSSLTTLTALKLQMHGEQISCRYLAYIDLLDKLSCCYSLNGLPYCYCYSSAFRFNLPCWQDTLSWQLSQIETFENKTRV